jgi:Icc-related predicted phosphoesterase
MSLCFFVSDLHGHQERYRKLFQIVLDEAPAVVFLGGDLLPAYPVSGMVAFFDEIIKPGFAGLRQALGASYPRVFLILGNDDPRKLEEQFLDESDGLWEYLSCRQAAFDGHPVYGYPFVPPTPFMLKDWERYDVSRYVDPGCISPEEGWRTTSLEAGQARHRTIQSDLDRLLGEQDLASAILLFHTPPYQTALDRAALDGRMIDSVPLDVNVGSIAVRRLIEHRQPLASLHGHIHESARLTGSWREKIGATWAFSAAHDGPELALIRFDPDALDNATRSLLQAG